MRILNYSTINQNKEITIHLPSFPTITSPFHPSSSLQSILVHSQDLPGISFQEDPSTLCTKQLPVLHIFHDK